MLPIERKISRKIIGIHNIDSVISLVAHLEILTRKLDKLTQNMSMMHKLTQVCVGSWG